MAVIKANAYGFGKEMVTQILLDNNINKVIFYNIYEAIDHRKKYLNLEIYCVFIRDKIDLYKDYQIIPIVCSYLDLEIIKNHNLFSWLMIDVNNFFIGISHNEEINFSKYPILGLMSHVKRELLDIHKNDILNYYENKSVFNKSITRSDSFDKLGLNEFPRFGKNLYFLYLSNY